MFFRGSRYEGVPEAELSTADALSAATGEGRTIRYKRIRFIPETPGPETPGTVPYRVQPDDRPDHVAYKTAGDPELFWRLCDTNRVMRPDELTETPGRVLRIPAPGS